VTPAQVAAVAAEAREWLGTPYHHAGRVKGPQGGVDCGMLLIEVYSRAEIVPVFDPGFYTSDWYFHRDEEQYLGWIARYCDRIDAPEVGDIVLYRFGRTASHGGIVIEPGYLLHAYRPARQVEIIEMRTLDDRVDSYWRVKA